MDIVLDSLYAKVYSRTIIFTLLLFPIVKGIESVGNNFSSQLPYDTLVTEAKIDGKHEEIVRYRGQF